MCIAFWTLTHPQYALILASNRDEFFSRPTIPADWHNFNHPDASDKDVLSGRDGTAGGTWLGINKKGDLALLTNITESTGPYATSRGELVSSFLSLGSSLEEPDADRLSSYVSSLLAKQHSYAGFNLLLLSPSGFQNNYQGVLVTNSGGGGQITSRPLSEQECLACGLSNANDIHTFTDSEWPKVSQGKQLFAEVVTRDYATQNELVDALCKVMGVENPTRPTTRYQLRTTISVPPIAVQPIAWSRSVDPRYEPPVTTGEVPASRNPASEPFQDYYGTRLTSVVLVRRDGQVMFVERNTWVQEEQGAEPIKHPGTESERRFHFTIKR